MNEQHNIAGGWLGTYTYRGSQRVNPPIRFEATLVAGDGDSFYGTILDDGKGGEARVEGAQDGNRVRFTKIYLVRAAGYGYPVEYEGIFSEDGRTIKGTWHIKNTLHGAWEARRRWSEEGASEQTEEPEVLTREWTTVGI